MRDPYETLGVPRTAGEADIKSAYRRLAKELHPDLHGGSETYAARFRDVTAAYAVLSDPDQRKAFDTRGEVDQQQVDAVVQEVYSAIDYVRRQTASAKQAARGYANRGLAWLIGGAAVSLVTFLSARSAGGGTYYVFWGAIVFGAIQAVRGFASSSRIEAKAREIERQLWAIVTGSERT